MWKNYKDMKFQDKNTKYTSWKKELYGLRQDSRAWYSYNDSYLTHNGFRKSESEPTLYTKVNE